MAVSNSKSSAVSNAIPRSSAFLRLLAGSNSIGTAIRCTKSVKLFCTNANTPELAFGGEGGARRRSRGRAARGCGRRRIPRTKRGERGARLLARKAGGFARKAGKARAGTAVSRSDAPRARRSWSLAPRFGASRPLTENPAGFGALSASARTRLAPGRARPPPGRAARLVAPETGRRRTLRHRLARTGSAPHQPRPASRPKPPPRASRTRLSRACPIHPSTMPPHVTTPHERAPLPGGMGHVRTKCERLSRTFFASPEGEGYSDTDVMRQSGPWFPVALGSSPAVCAKENTIKLQPVIVAIPNHVDRAIGKYKDLLPSAIDYRTRRISCKALIGISHRIWFTWENLCARHL